jgi:hypothetical protein
MTVYCLLKYGDDVKDTGIPPPNRAAANYIPDSL